MDDQGDFILVTKKQKGKKKLSDLAVKVNENHIDSENKVVCDSVKRSEVVKENGSNAYVEDGSAKPGTSQVIEEDIKDKENETENEEPIEEYHSSINRRALSKHALTYEIEDFEKNALLIFNQENVDGYKKPRLGTDRDVAALTHTFEQLRFDVKECKDYTKEEVFRELKKFTETDFTDYGCIAVAVLTHGTKNGLLRAKDELYSELEILNYFKVWDKPTLVTKPKVLIIQACRGKNISVGVPVMQRAKIRKDFEEEFEPYYLPVESDMLVIHSSYFNNTSFRCEVEGSWLIQTLCRKISELSASQDLESIITHVKREVAINQYHEQYNRRTCEVDINKQIPVMTSTLTRKLYLQRPPTSPSSHHTLRIPEGHQVTDSGTLNTSSDAQFGQCQCYLDHFRYIKDCLSHYLEENPCDETARDLLQVADTLHDTVEFHIPKQRMLKAICNHLKWKTKETTYNKYLHFFKD